MLSPDNVASLGSDQAAAESRMETIFSTTLMAGLTPANKAIMLMQMATVWRCACQVSNLTATRRIRMEENPHTVPDLPEDTYILMCEQFAKLHPQDFGLAQDTPHTRFVARLKRDMEVDGIIPDYALGWVRLKSETVHTKPGWSKTADSLVKLQQMEEPTQVVGADDTRNRIIAYYKALLCPSPPLSSFLSPLSRSAPSQTKA